MDLHSSVISWWTYVSLSSHGWTYVPLSSQEWTYVKCHHSIFQLLIKIEEFRKLEVARNKKYRKCLKNLKIDRTRTYAPFSYHQWFLTTRIMCLVFRSFSGICTCIAHHKRTRSAQLLVCYTVLLYFLTYILRVCVCICVCITSLPQLLQEWRRKVFYECAKKCLALCAFFERSWKRVFQAQN